MLEIKDKKTRGIQCRGKRQAGREPGKVRRLPPRCGNQKREGPRSPAPLLLSCPQCGCRQHQLPHLPGSRYSVRSPVGPAHPHRMGGTGLGNYVTRRGSGWVGLYKCSLSVLSSYQRGRRGETRAGECAVGPADTEQGSRAAPGHAGSARVRKEATCFVCFSMGISFL